MSACDAPPSSTPRSSSPTALLSEPADPNWEYEYPELRSHLIQTTWAAGPDDIWGIADVSSLFNEDNSALAHWDGRGWTIGEKSGHQLANIWGTAGDDVWISGGGGTLMHYDGASWSTATLDMGVFRFAGTGPKDLYIVGYDADPNVWNPPQQIRHFDGQTWTAVPNPSSAGYIFQLQAAGKDDLWAVNLGRFDFNGSPLPPQLFHWDGKAWTEDREGETTDYTSLTLSSGQGVWLLSPAGLEHWDGARWLPAAQPPTPGEGNWYQPQVVGTAGGNSWLIASDGAISRTDGACWQQVRKLGPVPQLAYDGYVSRALLGGSGWVGLVDPAGALLAADRNGWIDRTAAPRAAITSISTTSDGDAWAVGEQGVVLHRTSAGWVSVPSGTTTKLTSVFARARDDVWISSVTDFSGHAGSVLHFDGVSISAAAAAGLPAEALVITGSPAGDLWAFGPIYESSHWDGSAWTVQSPFSEVYSSVAFAAASPTSAWRAGSGGFFGWDNQHPPNPRLDHWDGQSWVDVPTSYFISAFSGTSANSIWALDQTGLLLHYDGATWSPFSPAPPQWPGIPMIWAGRDDDLWIPGGMGVRHFDGAAWTTVPLRFTDDSNQVTAIGGAAPGDVWVGTTTGVLAHHKR